MKKKKKHNFIIKDRSIWIDSSFHNDLCVTLQISQVQLTKISIISTLLLKFSLCLVFLLPKTLKLFSFQIFLTLSVPDEGYSRNVSCALNLLSTFFSYTEFHLIQDWVWTGIYYLFDGFFFVFFCIMRFSIICSHIIYTNIQTFLPKHLFVL